MSYNSLKIKDGVGDLKSLAVVSSSDGYYPVHVIDPEHTVRVRSVDSERVWVTGNVVVDNFPATYEVSNFPETYTVLTDPLQPLKVLATSSINNFPATYTVLTDPLQPLKVLGTASINNFPSVQIITSSLQNPINEQKAYGTAVSEVIKTTFDWNTNASGTFNLANLDYNRRELIIHNTGPGILYIKVSATAQSDSTKHGFTLINTSSNPSVFNFVVYPSGTYLSSEASRVLYHAGYFVSSSVTGTVVATSIS